MITFRSMLLLAMLGLAGWTPLAAAAGCPPGPFYCIPWGPGTPVPNPVPPPGPFKPAPPQQGILEIKPTENGDNDKLLKVLQNKKRYSALSASDMSKITERLGDKTKLLDPSTYYIAPKANGNAVYFKGEQVQR